MADDNRSTSLPHKWRRLAADLLDLASDKFGNHTCNDFGRPADWTQEEWDALSFALHEANGDPQDFEPGHTYLSDSFLMWYFAKRLREGHDGR
jgi:hypothetical protein